MLGPRTLALLNRSSDALGQPARASGAPGRVGDELSELLVARNGFYGYQSALHVLPAGNAFVGASLESWNAPDGWRASYGSMANGLFFFAEDVFGGQFAIRGDQVVTFDPETGEIEAYASSIEDWADQLQADYEVMTGQPLAEQWQTVNGGLSPGDRLVPRVPFVLGGEFEVANVYAIDAALGMQVRGDLAVQLVDLPDGAQVTYRVVD